MIIAVDFDGTCVTHEYPQVGRGIGAASVLQKLVRTKGHLLILWTMRSGKELADAERWFADNDIPLFGVNHNEGQKSWTDSPKVFANLYIDDAAFGAPLLPGEEGERPYINWKAVEEALLG